LVINWLYFFERLFWTFLLKSRTYFTVFCLNNYFKNSPLSPESGEFLNFSY